MTRFDLLFIVLALGTLFTLMVAAIAALRGRFARLRTLMQRLGMAVVVYFALVVVASLATPQRYLSLQEAQCSDDWCITVQRHQQVAVAGGTQHDVTLQLSSRAKRVPQRERFVVVYLRDAAGQRHDMLDNPPTVPFDTLLGPGEMVDAERRFIVPSGASIVGVVVAREGGGRFPGCCIIGDEGSLFHKRTIVRFK